MDKKFLPPRLVRGFRWYVVWYEPTPDGFLRQRLTFDLNRIRDEKVRELRAKQLIQELTRELSRKKSPPPVGGSGDARLLLTSLEAAVALAVQSSDRERTQQSYASYGRILMGWMKENKYGKRTLSSFSKSDAVAYLDWIELSKRPKAKSWNMYLQMSRRFFQVMVEREWMEKNPFAGIRSKPKTQPKDRRNFSPDEVQAVARHLVANDPILYLAIVLEFYGLVRPSEIRQLKPKNFDLVGGILRIPAGVAKDHEERIVTLPRSILHLFIAPWFERIPAEWYVFGRHLKPHPSKPCGRNTLNLRHRAALDKLLADGSLHDITGLSLYSWKDTGITSLVHVLPPIEVRDQAGHSSLEVTMRYYHQARGANPNIRSLPDFLSSPA